MSNKVAKSQEALTMAQRENPPRVTVFKKPEMLIGAPFGARIRVAHIDAGEYAALFTASCELLGEPHIMGDDDSRFVVDGVWMGSRYEWGMSSNPKVGHGLVYAKESDWLAVKQKAGWKD